MPSNKLLRLSVVSGLCLGLAACGMGGGTGWFSRDQFDGVVTPEEFAQKRDADAQRAALARARGEDVRENTIWDLFENTNDPNDTVRVNKYLWQASLEILNFLPIETIDPFTGVIVTGYGTPPGGGRVYRATIYVQDPALEARSLKISLQTRGGGAVSADTVRAVEDAILTRARQLRLRDSKL